MATVILTLPDDLRGDLKEPWGPVFEDVETLLADAGQPVIAVGDVVTYYLERAGHPPDVALVDEMTERSAVADHVAEALAERAPDEVVENPAATLTEELLVALRDAVSADGSTRILVDGEEDLAAIPAIVTAPDGATVVYGQPGEGMVRIDVAPEVRERAVDLLRRLDGDVGRTLELLA